MHYPTIKLIFVLSLYLFLFTRCDPSRNSPLGLFEEHGDIGQVNLPGSVAYDEEQETYLITGSGENMWFDNDALHFVWKKDSGNVSLASTISWPDSGGNAHRKACLLIRQSLAPDAPYADAVVHGDGLTSIQYREEPGGPTREIQANISAPKRLRIEKTGDYVTMSVGEDQEEIHSSGGTFKIKIQDPFYIGLGVCSHDSTTVEKALFSDVAISHGASAPTDSSTVESTLETIAIASKDRRVVYHTSDHIEAPNWTTDSNSLIFNSEGHLFQIPVKGGKPQRINTGFATHCNNDHGISPDGSQLVISDQTEEEKSLIYTLPMAGGTPKRITAAGPSYWHGWSPDGKTLAFCGERDGKFDIYTIPVGGGREKRLTTAAGLDDGPDYSPDGQYIYFNSVRSGTMQIWRMNTNGSDQQPITSDGYNNWFAHPSPDGKWIVFLTYEKEVEGHPANKDVMLRLMPVEGGEIQVLAKLFGGQGTINVPSWSPDSQHIAFVSYSQTSIISDL